MGRPRLGAGYCPRKRHWRCADVRVDEPRGAAKDGRTEADVVLLKVTQLGHEPGIACHTGRHSCFFQSLQDDQWQATDPVLKDPETIYK